MGGCMQAQRTSPGAGAQAQLPPAPLCVCVCVQQAQAAVSSPRRSETGQLGPGLPPRPSLDAGPGAASARAARYRRPPASRAVPQWCPKSSHPCGQSRSPRRTLSSSKTLTMRNLGAGEPRGAFAQPNARSDSHSTAVPVLGCHSTVPISPTRTYLPPS